MQIRVLGCSGSIAAGSRTTSFLLDDDVLIDAGTGVGDLTLDELARIDHIFISHSHLDHVLAVGLLADSVTRRRTAARRPPVLVHALAPTLAALRTPHLQRRHLARLHAAAEPRTPGAGTVAVRGRAVLHLGTRSIEVLPAAHTVPAVGFAASNGNGAWVFTGDTGPNPALWQRLATMDLRALVIETAFRDDEHVLASVSKHLCPAQLRAELAHLQSPMDVYITHIKPGEVDAVMSEIGAQASQHRIRALASGDLITLPAAAGG